MGVKAVVLLLDLPEAAFCGIDLLSFTASPRFRGIKELPEGWHFVFTSASNSSSIRHGAWFYVTEALQGTPEVSVKIWSLVDEEITPGTESESAYWRAHLGGIWRESLTPYRQSAQNGLQGDEDIFVEENKQDWLGLTNKLSADLLSRILGSHTKKFNHWHLTSATSAREDQDDIPGIDDRILHAEKELGFLPINLKQTWRAGAVGRERTEAARDRSWALEDLISREETGTDALLGETQFAFLMVLTLNNNSCLEQWKRILGLVLTCISAVTKQSDFFVHFLALLRIQLRHCFDAEGSLFDMADEAGNLLTHLLRRFRHGLDLLSGVGKSNVVDELDELEGFLKSEHGWLMNDPSVKRGMLELEDGERVEIEMNGSDEEQEDGDFAPTIVELTHAQAWEMGLDSTFPLTLLQRHGAVKLSSAATTYEDDDRDLEEMDDRY